ncbi:peptidase S9 [Flavobacterium suaedae]|uniref:Peptidase S9 n=1 Tax=Flavobacterium suaedae TaxID=1767027 RepID=A0ABQ1JN40_9FLAO|nr:S9 family peptidase [Flavobacterium suaedae]GGB70390.1 peptidase S9 [Flavobacterium suaedae]
MISIKRVLFLLLLIATPALAQRNITLEEIWSGAFRTQGMYELHSMENSNQYTVLDVNWATGNSSVDLYDFKTLEKVSTLISSKDFAELNSIDAFTFSPDEKKMLIATNTQPIYRHSFFAEYYIYDIATKSLKSVADIPIQEPVFSADNSKVAYAHANNLYYYDVATGNTQAITKDGERNAIINGITDWVYEEEFAFVRAFDWNKAGDKIAYIRFDEREVPEFTMEYYNMGLYPYPYTFKYPKAGENNSKVSLHIYDVKTGTTKQIALNSFNPYYIPRIKWTNDAQTLSVQLMNRHQNNLDLVFVDANTGKTTGVLNETDKAYINITDNLTFLKDNSFIWTSEKDGYNHIYHYNEKGKLIKQITEGNWEVTAFYGFDDRTGNVFYQSVENGSINRDVYSININGKRKTRLTPNEGTNEATFSPDFDYFINSYSSATTPPVYTLHESKKGKLVKTIKNNQGLANKLDKYNLPKKKFTVITTPKGHELNAWMIKPADFDPNKKYPVFMYQYSGPGSQEVSNQWHSYNDYWFMMLAQQGYIVACVDGRGTGFKGAAFKKVTYKELGKYEVEDQIDAAKVIGGYDYVDESRIGIFGWSFGGFMSSNCILKGNDVFKMAIAVAPVTNWRFYDTVYTERYMQTPQENASGYDENSPINHVKKLKGDYLLVHGSADDNVHLQNTMLMVEALVQANKQFDWAIYPDKNHGIYGGATRLQLYTKMTNFIKEKL